MRNRAAMRLVLGLAGMGAAGLAAPVAAQTSASAFTTAYRYDAARRLTGTIAPGASGTAAPYVAVRNTYDDAGNLIRQETGSLSTWKADTIAPASWGTSFTVARIVETTYDALARKVKEVVKQGSATPATSPIYALTQYSYDSVGRLECTAVRMGSPTELASVNSANPSACTPSLRAYGYDRITKNEYDAAGQLTKVYEAYGTSLQQVYAAFEYTPNGKRKAVVDANGNRAEMHYDGFDRQDRWTFPSKTTAGQVNTADYEGYGYDANGNRTSLRKRDGTTILYAYDNLNRMVTKDIPGTADDISYSYDLQGLRTGATFTNGGAGISNVYDGFGRLVSTTTNQSGTALTIGHQYDADGNRIRTTWPDGQYVTYEYDGLDRMKTVKQSGSTVIASMTYNAQSLLASETHGGVTTTYGYDDVLRLESIADNLAGTSGDVTTTLAYNPADQIVTRTRSNDAYAYTGYVNVDRSYARNGLNQYTAVGGTAFCYDANGNLTSDGTTVYQYDRENRLRWARDAVSTACPPALTGAIVAGMVYDPLGRLYQSQGTGAPTTRYLYDGDELVAEYNTAGTLLRRYVHGAGDDDPLIWYEGAGLTDRRSLQTDHQGSIVSIASASGTLLTHNSYDEYGIPAAGNLGTFQYTGQAWIASMGMYYYKARIYSPTLGRFLQTDPIGYDDQINLYAYVGNDPVNGTDPTGMKCLVPGQAPCAPVQRPADSARNPRESRQTPTPASKGHAADAMGYLATGQDAVAEASKLQGASGAGLKVLKASGVGIAALAAGVDAQEQIAAGKPADEAVANASGKVAVEGLIGGLTAAAIPESGGLSIGVGIVVSVGVDYFYGEQIGTTAERSFKALKSKAQSGGPAASANALPCMNGLSHTSC